MERDVKHVAMSEAHYSWHVRQLYKLRKWKPARAELRAVVCKPSRRLYGRHIERRLLRGLADNPAVFSHGDRVSDPIVVMREFAYRMRRRFRIRRRSRMSVLRCR